MSQLFKSSEPQPFFLSKNSGFIQAGPEDDLLHPDSFANIKDDSATETQYFGFSVPAANIHGFAYLWHRPNLKLCSGGLFVFQGAKHNSLHAELCDWRTFMSDKVLANDLHEFRFDNGYGVKLIEPLKRLHMTYTDTENNNSVDLLFDAVMPPVMFDDGNHFEQTMAVKGELVLSGKHYAIDCFTVRDRSWGKPRPETLMPLPPMSWMTGVFNQHFSFNCNVFDQDSNTQGKLSVPDNQSLSGGWIYRDGKVGRIIKANKRVLRGFKSMLATGVELQLTDDHGREFDLRALPIASCPHQFWNNMHSVISLVRWECDGNIGYGDLQEAFWNRYLKTL